MLMVRSWYMRKAKCHPSDILNITMLAQGGKGSPSIYNI
jgi:hypothetical protein